MPSRVRVASAARATTPLTRTATLPARSEAQRRYLNAKFGHAWVKRHDFDNAGPLPARVGKKKRRARPLDKLMGAR